ncbi:MAG: hypothetical protein ACLGIS_10945 [Actinomycetes bacterium]
MAATRTPDWASEPSRPPWRMVEHAPGRPLEAHGGQCDVLDAGQRLVASFARCRDAAYICAVVNGEAAPPRPMTVRFIRTDCWLGACHYCQPAHLLLGDSAMSTLAALGEHFKTTHPLSEPSEAPDG